MSTTSPTTGHDINLPPEWEMRTDVTGRVYFANHLLKTTQWHHPITGKNFIARTKATQQAKTQDTSNQLVNLFPESFTAMGLLHGQDLDGRVFVITGGNSGIGFRTAEALACHGGHVIIACRNMKKAQESVNLIQEECKKKDVNGNIEAMLLDLASFRSVRSFVENFKSRKIPLNVLICNAAVLGYAWQTTQDNIEYTFAVNYLGHFHLIDQLKDILLSSLPSRIIMVTSESHRFVDLDYSSCLDLSLVPLPKDKYWSILAYNQSKLCCLMLAMELNRRYQSHGLTSYAVHPGNLIYTSLCQSSCLYKLVFSLAKPFSKTPSQAATTLVYCATAQMLDRVGGFYLNGNSQGEPSAEATDKTKAKLLWDKSYDLIHRNEEINSSCNSIIDV